MKRFTGNLAVKIAAVILSYTAVLTLVLSVSATVLLGYYKFYFSNEATVKEEILTDMAQSEAYYIQNLIKSGVNLDKYYSDKNVYFEIVERDSGKVTESNFDGQAYSVTASSEYYDYNEYYYADEEGNEYWKTEEKHVATINIYVSEEMTKNDIFSVVSKIIEIGFRLEYAVIFIMFAALILAIVLLCFLYASAGHRSNGKIWLNVIDRIPFDIYTAFIALAAVVNWIFVDSWFSISLLTVAFFWLLGTADYFLLLGYTMSFATRVKTRTLIKNTLIYRIFIFFRKYLNGFFRWLKYIFSNLSLIKKTLVIIAIVLFIEAICIIVVINSFWYYDEFLIVFVIPVNLIFIAAAVYLAITLQRIKQGGEKIAGGDLAYKIDTKYMYSDFKSFSESLNNINEGLQTAVNERMRSERFKTELITNVSHDIKTPLTSIINYVGLIKKEEPENAKMREYLEVLDRQSTRLKKLVEDLVEASKASSGSLTVDLAPCNVGVLLSQALGEFEDRLLKAQVKPILNLPESSVKIMADGRHLWRVFDNLLSNVCKYALQGTRVYIDVSALDGRAVITFRNISRYQLNISAEELMERFVRGDTSRNTEGSGLGLSIAKSLVELQNGSMELDVDGDLFKVTVSFDLYER